MNANFCRTLSLLRKERGISQRQAAGALGISQALLSHYENGVREPGLEFVVRAADFYHVSADFLLGRTLSRDGTTIVDADALYDASEERDNVLRGSVLATLSKKLVVNSVSLLFDLLGRLGNKKATRAAANFMCASVYTLYRGLYRHSPDRREDVFSIPDRGFNAGLTYADMILCISEYADALEGSGKDPAFPPMDHDAMAARYPGAYQSLLQIIHSCGTRMNHHLDRHQNNEK